MSSYLYGDDQCRGPIKKRASLLRIYRGESPIFVQLFGGDPYTLAEASSLAESFGAHGIDLNMGCPADQWFE